MSIKLMTLVWDRFPGAGSELLLMLAFADYANDVGDKIFPSVDTVSNRLRLSHRQAQRLIGGLITDGWIELVGNANGGAPGTTRNYRMNVSRLLQQPLFESMTDDADVTGDVDVTRVAGDGDGCHGRPRGVTPVSQTGVTHVTQPTNNHQLTTKDPIPVSADAGGEPLVIITKHKRKLTGWKLIAFMRFWEVFDYKHGRAEAADAWLDIANLDAPLVDAIVFAASVEAGLRPGILRRNGTPKMAQGWLTARRWEDEAYQPKEKPKRAAQRELSELEARRIQVLAFNARMRELGKGHMQLQVPEEAAAK
jgi:hypothetical protein